MSNKKVLITGVTGMMGSHAADLWLAEGWDVVAPVRPTGRNLGAAEHLRDLDAIKFVECDITDKFFISSLLAEEVPDVVLHYAAQSQVGTSFKQPDLTTNINVSGSLNLLEGMRLYTPEARGIFLATSEMFGNNFSYKVGDLAYQNEYTPFAPVSPYGCSKLNMYHLVNNYRDSYNMPVSCVIQFNTESERRREYFVTRKITNYVGKLHNLLLRNSGYVLFNRTFSFPSDPNTHYPIRS